MSGERPRDQARARRPPSEREPGVGPRRAPRKDGDRGHATRAKSERAQEKKRTQQSRNLQSQIADLENRIAEREQAIRDLEAAMSEPGFYEDRAQAQPLIDRHQALMWEVGELMHQWEELQRKVTRRYRNRPQMTIM